MADGDLSKATLITWRRHKSASRLMAPLALAAACLLLVHAGDAQESSGIRKRSFETIDVTIGDTRFEVPSDWMSAGFISISRGNQPFIRFVNLNQRTERLPHWDAEIPKLISLELVLPGQGLAARNIQAQRQVRERRWSERQPDEHGFWQWHAFWQWNLQEYLLVEPHHVRPLDQPLSVSCFGSSARDAPRCTVGFYWTHEVGVRYSFFDDDVPKRDWAELDRRVLALVKFLDSRHAGTKPD